LGRKASAVEQWQLHSGGAPLPVWFVCLLPGALVPQGRTASSYVVPKWRRRESLASRNLPVKEPRRCHWQRVVVVGSRSAMTVGATLPLPRASRRAKTVRLTKSGPQGPGPKLRRELEAAQLTSRMAQTKLARRGLGPEGRRGQSGPSESPLAVADIIC
jgi:hypothetical protein